MNANFKRKEKFNYVKKKQVCGWFELKRKLNNIIYFDMKFLIINYDVNQHVYVREIKEKKPYLLFFVSF
jgi:hypothetical protein